MSDQNEQVVYTQEDIDTNKGMGILAYFIFFIPLLVEPAKNSPYAKFHVNQGLLIVLAGIAVTIVAVIPIIGWIIALIAPIVIFVFWVMALMGAIKGEAKPLPLIGGIKIIK